LVKRTKTGSGDVSVKSWRYEPKAKIPAQSYYLWVKGDYFSLIADASIAQAISSNNGVALRYGAENTGQIIDAVGWSNFDNVLFEGTVFPGNPPPNQSLGRRWIGGEYQDSDNNAEDFELQPPTPKNQNRSFSPAKLEVSPEVLEFSIDSFSKYLSITNLGEKSLNWQAAIRYVTPPVDGWLSIFPDSGQLSASETKKAEVSQYLASFPEGEYQAKIIVDAGQIEGSPKKIEVLLKAADDTPPRVSFNPFSSIQREPIFTLSWQGEDMIPVTPIRDGVSFVSPSGIDGFLLVYTSTSVLDGVAAGLNGLQYFDFNLNQWKAWLEDKILFVRDTFLKLLGKDRWTYFFQIKAQDKAGNVTENWVSDPPISTKIELLPQLKISSLNFNFLAREGGINPREQTLTIENAGLGDLSWHITPSMDGIRWFSLSQESGELSAQESSDLRIYVETANLVEGSYETAFTLEGIDIEQKPVLGSPKLISVNLTVLPQVLSPKIASPDSDVEFYISDDVDATTSGVQIWVKGIADPLDYVFDENSTSSLVQTQADKDGNWQIKVTLKEGQNVFSFKARAEDELEGESSSTSLVAYLKMPILKVSPDQFNFRANEGKENPEDQFLTIKNLGDGNLKWYATGTADWLLLESASGTVSADSSTTIKLSVDISGLEIGIYGGILTIEAPDAKNSPTEILVTLNLQDTTPPIANAGEDRTVELNESLTFNGSASTDNVGIVSYKWDIDNSNGLDWEDPDLTGENPTLESEYSTSGIYIVTLQVSDGAGNLATDSLVVTVVEPQPTLSKISAGFLFSSAEARNNGRKIARDSNGNLYVTYSKDGKIFLAISTDQGRDWNEILVTPAEETLEQKDPSIVIDSKDNLHFVWQGKIENNPYWQIRYSKYEGSTFELIDTLTPNPNRNQILPVISVDSKDTVWIAWVNDEMIRCPPNVNDVWCDYPEIHLLSLRENWQEPEGVVGGNDNYWITSLSMAIDSQDRIHLAWLGASGAYNYAINYRQGPNPWSQVRKITTGEAPGQPVSIAIDSSGNAHIVWSSIGGYSDPNRAFRYSYLRYTNSKIWDSTTPIELVVDDRHPIDSPSIAIDASDRIGIVWKGVKDWQEKIFQIEGKEEVWQQAKILFSGEGGEKSPNLLWSFHPTISGIKTNRPKSGYALIYYLGQDLNFYSSSDLTWE